MSETQIRARFSTLPQGDWAAGGLQELRDPGNIGELVGRYPLLDTAVVDAAVARAATAQSGWAAMSPLERWDLISRGADAVDASRLATLLVLEQGKPIGEARLEAGSLRVVADRYRAQAEWLAEQTSQGAASGVRYTPYGVAGVITPWNWPVRIACALTVPALLAGNSVVLHLAPSAPLTALAVFTELSRALPEGVLTVLTHPSPEIASALVAHPGVRKIAFTGSTQVGGLVMSNAAATLKNVTLELGGNDPAVLLDDAVLDDALADALIEATFQTSGQVCMAVKRLYAPRAMVPDLADLLRSRLDAQVVGHGLAAETTMGPLHNEKQLRFVKDLVARSSSEKVVEAGRFGTDPTAGWYMLPTLVIGADQASPLVQDEQFGPALPIVAYDSEDEAVSMANDSEFGLCSSIWSADPERAFGVATRIEAGTTWINKHGARAQDPEAPFGGVKRSGVGRISGRSGLLSFLEPHSILL